MDEQLTVYELRNSLIRSLADFLSGNEARSISEIILEHFHITNESILKNPSHITNNEIQAEIKKIVAQLQQNKPIQYILGKGYFYDRFFEVNEFVLIPRPETEELVDQIIKENEISEPVILDIGTGSGCIAVTLKKEIKDSIVLALDIDPKCLETARINSDKFDADLLLINGNILDCKSLSGSSWIDIIVSNPPYVTMQDKKRMYPNVVDFEPVTALYVPDDDPLIYYRKILAFANTSLSDKGVIWVEINERLGKETLNLFYENGFLNAELRQDIHGKDRFIKAPR